MRNKVPNEQPDHAKSGESEKSNQISELPDPKLGCAEDNPFMPLFPPHPQDGDKLTEALRSTSVDKADLHLHLHQFLRPDEPAKGDKDFDLQRSTCLSQSEYDRMEQTRRLSFDTFGCSGDPAIQAPQAAVADAIIASQRQPDPSAFLFHLGDIVYKEDDQERIEDGTSLLSGKRLLQLFYSNEFYAAYRGYERPIFAIPGNHDGKYRFRKNNDGSPSNRVQLEESVMWRFLRNFCAPSAMFSDDNPEGMGDPNRPTMTQPFPFFVLKTPVADIIGLYTNVCNGGALDLDASTGKKTSQFQWFVRQLTAIKKERKKQERSGEVARALIVAMHYPPFSASTDFSVRGDVHAKTTPKPRPAEPLANVLLAAFIKAGIWPDLVLSAHAHHYQRLTYSVPFWDSERKEWDVCQIPFLIVGCGGHGPVESLWRDCAGNGVPERTPPFDVLLNEDIALPKNDRVQLAAYNDQDFGYLRVTVDLKQRLLFGEFCTALHPELNLRPGRVRQDTFLVDLTKRVNP